jgi:hypothetical protein
LWSGENPPNGPAGALKKWQKRPYEIVASTSPDYSHADGAYDPRKGWLKKPDLEKAKEMWQSKIGDVESREHKAYAKIEKTIQQYFKTLHGAVEKCSAGNCDPAALAKAMTSAAKKEKAVWGVRGVAYGEIEPGYVSKNWGFGNVIFKMLDREGYMDIFKLLHKFENSEQLLSNPEALAKLEKALGSVVGDPLGFEVGRMGGGAAAAE